MGPVVVIVFKFTGETLPFEQEALRHQLIRNSGVAAGPVGIRLNRTRTKKWSSPPAAGRSREGRQDPLNICLPAFRALRSGRELSALREHLEDLATILAFVLEEWQLMELLEWEKDNTVNIKAAERMTPEQLQGKIITGLLYQADRPEYVTEYDRHIARVQAKAGAEA